MKTQLTRPLRGGAVAGLVAAVAISATAALPGCGGDADMPPAGSISIPRKGGAATVKGDLGKAPSKSRPKSTD